MLPINFAFLVALWLSVFGLDYAESRKLSWDVLPPPPACDNCTICQYPCHSFTPPSPLPPEYPLDGAAPPPPSLSDYPAPPTPVNCTPVPVLCCSFAPPYPAGYQPPSPGGYQPPPHPVGYQPYWNYSPSCSPLQVVLVMILLCSITILF